MLPDFNTYVSRYLKTIAVSIWVPCVLLSTSLARNTVDISLLELILGLGSIALSVAYCSARDAPGFWSYAVRTLRLFDTKARRSEISAISRSLPLRTLLATPRYAALLMFVITAFISFLGYELLEEHRDVLIYLCGGIILPLLMMAFAKWSVGFHLYRAFEQLASAQNTEEGDAACHRLPSLRYLITSDLLLSLFINLVLVLPIQRKAAFSLQESYSSTQFMVAFTLLLLIVALFMLFFAAKPRRLAFVGEMLSMKQSERDRVSYAPWLRWTTHISATIWTRYACYTLFILLWGFLLCQLFDTQAPKSGFNAIYFTGLLPIVMIYLSERYGVLVESREAAIDTVKRVEANGVLERVRGAQ